MFADIPEFKEFRKPKYVYFKEGKPFIIQFLEDKATRFYTHTIHTSDNKWVKIKHDDSLPIMQEPSFKEKFRGRTIYRVNVLDITPVKVCPKCGAEFNALKPVPELCPRDNENLSVVGTQPRNEVKIFERGVQLFRQINGIMDAHSMGNPQFDPKKLPLLFNVTGSGLSMSIAVVPRPDIPVVEGDYELFDLDLGEFTNQEIVDMVNGKGLMDVFSDRRDSTDADEEKSDELDFSGGLPGLV